MTNIICSWVLGFVAGGATVGLVLNIILKTVARRASR